MLAPYTTFRIGGPARYFCEVTSEAELLQASNSPASATSKSSSSAAAATCSSATKASMASSSTSPSMIPSNPSPTEVRQLHRHGRNRLERLRSPLCEQGISGVECLAGIPGSVGGTPVQNVGAYGQEVASTITAVRAFDLETGAFVTLSHDQCGFAYRHSIFNTTQRGRYIVTAVTFRFDLQRDPTSPTPIWNATLRIGTRRALRRRRLMSTTLSVPFVTARGC